MYTQFAYRIYRNTPNNPIIGGTVTARTMEDASTKILVLNDVQVIHEVKNGLRYDYFIRNGEKVGILIYLNPSIL